MDLKWGSGYTHAIMSNTIIKGIISVNSKGIGFVRTNEQSEDVVIPKENLSFALSGDVVEASLEPKVPGQRQAGKVIKVLEPAHSQFVGTIKQRDNGEIYLSPDNHRIHIRPVLPDTGPGQVGQKAVTKIKSWKNPHVSPIGEVVQLLGKAGDHETEMQAIIQSGGFSENFPEVVSEAAKKLYDAREQIFSEAIADPKRKDLRGVTTFTIDPEDAKDFDDALSYQKLPNGNTEVGIHIADVSHYVEVGDHIDLEARDRGTSIYLVDRVIPMLPEVLSNDLCSLRPNEDRLAFSAVFEIDSNAKVVSEWYGQTIIHSDRRFSYEEAQAVLDDKAGDYYEELDQLMTLGRILRKKRYQNGAIAFEQPEVKFKLDEKGKPISVSAKIRTETMLMIEDFMLLANQKVATHIFELSRGSGKNTAFVYRVHDVPDPDKIEELSIFLHALGYELKSHKGVVKAQDINKLLKEIEGKPEENLIKTATIRSMAKAVYTTKNIGHYGLAFKFYTHFTSPIRRYPDLMVHRLLRRHLDESSISGQEMATFEKLSVQSSEREAEAVRAERDSIKYKQVEYMSDKVGQTFTGIVTGVTDWGVYVEEKNSKAEGLVRLSSIKGEYYENEPGKYQVKGQRTGKSIRLGDEIEVKLTRADLEEKQLDFELA